MALPVWVDNLIAYSLQIAVLASAGTLLAYLFRLRMPRVSLIYWQVLLLACLLLPALQSWNHPVRIPTLATPGNAVNIIPQSTVTVKPKSSISITPEAIALALVAGICLRLIWLAVGFFRIRIFLRNAQSLPEAPQAAATLLSSLGVRARFFLSKEIDSPATFGILSPTVILPRSFSEMSETCREALVCHELLHVRRRDWAVILAEEIIRSIYWFHPAVWWLLGRIHLTREQSVDYEVVRLTGSRQPYLDSLLEIARARGRPKAVPAPLFLRERHLVQRVALLLKEVSMNRLRLAVSLFGIFVLLAVTVRLAAGWFPLTGAPALTQEQYAGSEVQAPRRAPLKVGGNVQMSKLIYRVAPIYPEQAKTARINGNVILVVTVNEEGKVSDVRVTSGHPLLVEAAISAVRQWRYSPTLLNGEPVPVMASVTIAFSIGPPPGMPSTLQTPRFDGAVDVVQMDGLGGSIVFRATPIDEKSPSSANRELAHAPELALDKERLHTLAEAGWPADVEKTTPLAYFFIVNEVSEIKGLNRVQGPDIPEVERELSQTRVVAPGLRGSKPISWWCIVEIRLPMDNK